ncbi:Rieske 2Fe-2S domain-containing protein [Streptomyces olivoreticuli]|uniref:Rieske 2Fe-2S domain-containing protein n=1 Tax=Streptomyces olivoreticuli TaxID=68246 RepID=UPI002659D48E|nr:Rieske 2Fe-2S domain-containing protein [Streptomyces olivoreticuli]WKK24005.1 Rieske 2Fe-2S domain-containing protein [Streptomyces olivoreticuli]
MGFAGDFKPGTVTTSAFMDGEIVIYRTRRGTLRVTRPYCPHLGAHLGAGGRIEGELLVCPFHHFAYAPDGTCQRTGAFPVTVDTGCYAAGASVVDRCS